MGEGRQKAVSQYIRRHLRGACRHIVQYIYMYSINLCIYVLTDSDKRQKQHCTRHTWVISRVCAHTNSSSFIHAASQLTFSLSSLRVACVRICLQNCSLHSDSAESPTLAPSSGSHEWSISGILTPHPPLSLSLVSLSALCHSILRGAFFITDMMLTVITEGH